MSITLGELISWLEKQNPDLIVQDGFSTPHSDRGNYENLAFDPEPSAKISDMLKHAKSALRKKFNGYKGGTFKMDRYTPVHIGYSDEAGEEITSIHFKYWLITGGSY